MTVESTSLADDLSHCFRLCLGDPRPVPLFQQKMRHPPETGQAPAGVGKMVVVSHCFTN